MIHGKKLTGFVSNLEKAVEPVNKKYFQRFKEEFRRWYGSLSVSELIENKELTAQIARIELLLSQQGG